MSQIIDNILHEVCLNEKIEDGIFNIENNGHLKILRKYLIKRGIHEDIAVDFSNKIIEGRFPHRQAYNANGILVTFPSPEHKAKAIARGTHFEKNPKPDLTKDREVTNDVPKEDDKEEFNNKSQNIFDPSPKKQEPVEEPTKEPNIFQGDQKLEIEPVDNSITPDVPVKEKPITPEKRQAEKELTKQIMATDPTAVEMPVFEEEFKQINEVYNYSRSKNYTHVMYILETYLNKQ